MARIQTKFALYWVKDLERRAKTLRESSKLGRGLRKHDLWGMYSLVCFPLDTTGERPENLPFCKCCNALFYTSTGARQAWLDLKQGWLMLGTGEIFFKFLRVATPPISTHSLCCWANTPQFLKVSAVWVGWGRYPWCGLRAMGGLGQHELIGEAIGYGPWAFYLEEGGFWGMHSVSIPFIPLCRAGWWEPEISLLYHCRRKHGGTLHTSAWRSGELQFSTKDVAGVS